MIFHHEELSPTLVRAIMSLQESTYFDEGEIRRYKVKYMDLNMIEVIDETGGKFMEDPDFEFRAFYLSHPAEIHIIPDVDLYRAKAVSRSFPIIGNKEHLDEVVYGMEGGVNEDNGKIYEAIMSDPNVEAIRNFRVSVVGAGEVGSWGMILMTMLGFENVQFFEKEDARLSGKHTGKMPYLSHDKGRLKSQLMLQRLHSMNPLTQAEYSGEMSPTNLEKLKGSKLIISAMDNTAAMADIHEFAFSNRIDLLLTTDIGKGAFSQLFRYSTGEIELLHGLVTPEELRTAQREKEQKEAGIIPIKEDKTPSPITKMLGMHRMFTQFDFETVKAFLFKEAKDDFGYLPQDPTAAFSSAAMTSTIAWKLATGQEIKGNAFSLDPDTETNRGWLGRRIQYLINAGQAGIIQRLKLLKDIKTSVNPEFQEA